MLSGLIVHVPAWMETEFSWGIEICAGSSDHFGRRGFQTLGESDIRPKELAVCVVNRYAVLHGVKGRLPFLLAAGYNLEQSGIFQSDSSLMCEGFRPENFFLRKGAG